MLGINRLLMLGLLVVGLALATTAQAGNQLFEGSWTVKAFGNECHALDGSPGSNCPDPASLGTGDSEFYTVVRMPQGIVCNANQPRCQFDSTPTDGASSFNPLGGHPDYAKYCAPWANWGGGGATMRPAKGSTATSTGKPVPPLYRNPFFFTTSGQPKTTSCYAASTDGSGGPGVAQLGNPVTGTVSAVTTGTQLGGFTFSSAPATGPTGVRTTGQQGEFSALYPYVYSYTYATVKNQAGVFGPSSGPGSFAIPYKVGKSTVASINVTQGAAKFGGTMRMLGALTSKVCYFRNGGCSLGQNNWRYDAIGTSAYTSGSVVTQGYIATYKAYYYHTALMQKSTINVEGARFPWTTGSVTLTAAGRGPHKTIEYDQGFDNRNTSTSLGKGTVQLVSPVLTRWLQPAVNFETGGISMLRMKFIPEPQSLLMLAAGATLLGVGYRLRGR
jgi:hypothetical protein